MGVWGSGGGTWKKREKKSVKVLKDKERLRRCYRLGEIKDTTKCNAVSWLERWSRKQTVVRRGWGV